MTSTPHRSKTVAIIVAGGQGRRMGHVLPKQFLPLGSRPILAHTLNTFRRCDNIRRIYLVTPKEYWDQSREQILKPLKLDNDIQLIPGGDERQDSVYNGLHAVESDTDWVVVHDGVRPLVTVKEIDRCLCKAREYGAAILAKPVADTLKKISTQGMIRATIPREEIWAAQTPQVFCYQWLWEAHQRANRENFRVTDDAQLLEWIGRPVIVVQGSTENIKITTPEDLRLAHAILQARRGGC